MYGRVVLDNHRGMDRWGCWVIVECFMYGISQGWRIMGFCGSIGRASAFLLITIDYYSENV